MSEADEVVRISPDERHAGAPTPGMDREEAIATETTWVGLIRTDAGMLSGWHHHGHYDPHLRPHGLAPDGVGPGGAGIVDASPGDFLLVPRGAIHREGNPSTEQGTAIVVRSGQGEAVVNVDGPAPSA